MSDWQDAARPQIRRLEELREQGAISDEEFEEGRREILETMGLKTGGGDAVGREDRFDDEFDDGDDEAVGPPAPVGRQAILVGVIAALVAAVGVAIAVVIAFLGGGS